MYLTETQMLNEVLECFFNCPRDKYNIFRLCLRISSTTVISADRRTSHSILTRSHKNAGTSGNKSNHGVSITLDIKL